MLSRDDHDTLVGQFYACALGDVPWRAVIENLASTFGSHTSVIQVKDSADTVVGFETHPFSKEFAGKFFAGEIYGNDPRVKHIAKVRPGTIYFDHALYDIDEIGRDPNCRACIDAIGSKYSLGAVASLPDGATGSLGLLSTEAQGHASRAAIGAFRRLAPHWAQAMSLGQIVEQRAATQAALVEALASKADGIILLGCSGAPTFCNDAARDILAADDGLGYCGGVFATRRAAETRRLQAMIHDAISVGCPSDARPGGQIAITRPSGRRPYVVRVLGAPPTERFLSGVSIACIIHLHDLAAVRLPSKAVLCAVFGLSEREGDFGVELVRCANLTDAAANCGMALNTARNHLQSIFAKSGTRTQAEAVQLLTRLA